VVSVKLVPRFKVFVAALVAALVGVLLVPTSQAGAVGDLSTVDVGLTPVVSGLNAPLAVVWRPGDPDMYVVEQNGFVRRIIGGYVVATPLTMKVSTGGERGLLGLAFSPNGTKAYINYTDLNGDTRVEEMPVNAKKKFVKASRRRLFIQQQPFANHNGGTLAFGPDGMLYIALGDGGSGGDPLGNGQNRNTLLGKILRISVTPAYGYEYSIPLDNPFVGVSGTRWEIWHYGLRNPWKFTFDKANGDMWIGDVGQNAREEVDVARAGSKGLNFGWARTEGFACFPSSRSCSTAGLTLPVADYRHDQGCSVVGGYVYRGQAFPALAGWYVFSDYCSGELFVIRPDGDGRRTPTVVTTTPQGVASFGEDKAGELYLANVSAGSVSRLVPSS
jgi:glucose/arabinose dehydrogenase